MISKTTTRRQTGGSSPRAEVRLQAAEAHHGDLQAGGPRGVARRSKGPLGEQRGAEGRAQWGAQASAQPAQGRHLGDRGVLPLGPRSLLHLLDGGELLGDLSVALAVRLRSVETPERDISFTF